MKQVNLFDLWTVVLFFLFIQEKINWPFLVVPYLLEAAFSAFIFFGFYDRIRFKIFKFLMSRQIKKANRKFDEVLRQTVQKIQEEKARK